MRYEVLGPLRVVNGDCIGSIGAQKVQVLFAVLLIRADQVVGVDQLMYEIWGERVPSRAVAALHVYVSQLRKFLSHPDRIGNPIETRPPGYVLHRGADELDLNDFQRSATQARAHLRAGRHEEAAVAYQAALDLWRGPALGDLRTGMLISGFARWLEETRLECLERLLEARLALGQHRELVGHLYALVAEFPLHETFHRQLMLALYRSGRQADALSAYRSARQILHGELGLEPGRPLRALQQAILADGEDLDDLHLVVCPAVTDTRRLVVDQDRSGSIRIDHGRRHRVRRTRSARDVREGVRVGAGALVAVESRDGGHVVRAELEVEDLEVLFPAAS